MLNTNQPFELVNFWEKIQPVRNKMPMTLKFFYWIMTNFVEDLKKTLSLFYKSFELVVFREKKIYFNFCNSETRIAYGIHLLLQIHTNCVISVEDIRYIIYAN
jgi:hypothetical protein